MEPSEKAVADLQVFLSNPYGEIERAKDDELPSLETLLKAEGLDYPQNPWLTAKAQQERAHEHHGDSRSRRHEVLADFLKAKLAEGFTIAEVVQHASKVSVEIGNELRVIASEIRQ